MYGYDLTSLKYLLPGMVLGLLAQWYVKATVERYLEEPTSGGRTGADIARQLLAAAGIHDVRVELHPGFLSDHYDPSEKALRLSEANYHGASIAAAGIAAHEAGHAIQHATGYGLMRVRQALVFPARFGSQLSYFIVFGGIAMHSLNLAWLGVLLFGGVFLFELVTVPVEINASMRAGDALVRMGLVTPQEGVGVRKVLTAAALTYIAAMISTLLTLLSFVARIRDQERR